MAYKITKVGKNNVEIIYSKEVEDENGIKIDAFDTSDKSSIKSYGIDVVNQELKALDDREADLSKESISLKLAQIQEERSILLEIKSQLENG